MKAASCSRESFDVWPLSCGLFNLLIGSCVRCQGCKSLHLQLVFVKPGGSFLLPLPPPGIGKEAHPVNSLQQTILVFQGRNAGAFLGRLWLFPDLEWGSSGIIWSSLMQYGTEVCDLVTKSQCFQPRTITGRIHCHVATHYPPKAQPDQGLGLTQPGGREFLLFVRKTLWPLSQERSR